MTPQLHVHQGKTFEDLEGHNPAFQSLFAAVQESVDAAHWPAIRAPSRLSYQPSRMVRCRSS